MGFVYILEGERVIFHSKISFSPAPKETSRDLIAGDSAIKTHWVQKHASFDASAGNSQR